MAGKKRGLGSKIKIGSNFIADLTSITPPQKSADTIDSTTLDNDGNYRTFIQSWKDGGTVTVQGYLKPGDAGQLALDTAFEDGTIDSYQIILPSTLGVTITFSAMVTAFAVGDLNLDDLVTFQATLKISGAVTSGTAASGGLSALSMTGTGGTLDPSFDNGTYSYLFADVTASSVTVTATAASHTILLYIDGVLTETLTTAVASSSIALTEDVVKHLTIVAYEDNKVPVVYDITVLRPAA